MAERGAEDYVEEGLCGGHFGMVLWRVVFPCVGGCVRVVESPVPWCLGNDHYRCRLSCPCLVTG